MYIKLRYRARLAQPAQIHEFISEVEDICQSHGWPYLVWDEDWQQPADVSGEFVYIPELAFKRHRKALCKNRRQSG